jgi:NADH-quinone oxidoreductase subunit C
MAERQEHPGQQQAALAPPPPGTVADLFREALPDVEFTPYQTAWDVALIVRREDLSRVMQAAKEEPRLAFDFLRSLSGVDTYQALEVVYHLYSFHHEHTVQIKAGCPYDDPHLPTVSHLWQTSNWHERETAELFGVVFDGHPDLRPLLTEEGLGYYGLRKSHSLAEIEESQEDYLKQALEAEARAQAAVAPGAPAAVDERAAKVALAQKKAEIMKKSREEARAKGISNEEEREYVRAALKAFEAEEAAKAPAAAAAPAQAVDERAAKVALAQKKAEVIKKVREEARAKGLPMEEEKAFVQAALKALEAEETPPPPAAIVPAAKPPVDRTAKVALAQKKAEVIKKAREEARARGMSSEEERRFVAEALKKFSAEQGES